MQASRYLSEKLLRLLSRYNSHVSRKLQGNPDKREELLRKFEGDMGGILYGIPADATDIIIEKAEDAANLATAPLTGGASVPFIEAISALIERLTLGPTLERKYHESMNKSHPKLSKGLKGYQYFTEIPGLDSILSIIPEKSLAAVGVLIHDIYKVTRDAKREYGKDYVKDLYGKQGVEGYSDERFPHPLRPAYT